MAPILYDILIPNSICGCWGREMLHTVTCHCDLDIWSQFLNNCIHGISSIVF